ncbi:MAG: DUF1080 domain-containing protein [Fuerstiella sp.]
MKHALITGLVASLFIALPNIGTADEQDAVQAKVDKAIATFKSTVEETRKQLIVSLETAANRAQRTGDLETLTEIQREKSAFESFGIVPTIISTTAFDRRMETARKRLVSRYESAVESFTRLGTIDAAKKTQQDLERFRQHGLMKTVELDLLDEQLSAWKPDNASVPHWSVRNGILKFDGTQGEKATLYTQRPFRNFSFRCQWRIGPGGDSGIFLRGVPQVQIWDHTRGNGKGIGSGGLYNNRSSTNAPTEIADKPIGQWNTMTITLVKDQVTVTLNGRRVTKKTKMENHPKHKIPLPTEGPIGLQAFRSPIEFRNLTVLELP